MSDTKFRVNHPLPFIFFTIFVGGVVLGMLIGKFASRPEIPVPIPPPITLPTTAKCDVGRMLLLEATTPGRSPVKWWVSDKIVDWHQEEANLYLTCPRAGRYTVLAWTVYDGKPTSAAECVVTFGAPGPEPIPPDPDPVPSDPLAKEMQAAYTADVGATKAEQVKLLRAAYVRAAGLCEASKAATWGELSEAIFADAKVNPVNGLLAMQAVAQREMTAAFPKRWAEPLTAEGRTKAAGVFRGLADAVGKVR